MRYSNYTKIDVLDDHDAVLISSTKMKLENEKIMVYGHDFPLIEHKKRVKMISYNQDGIVYREGTITLSTNTQMNIEIIKTSEKKDRRSYVKVKTKDMASIVRAYAFCDDTKRYKIEENVRIRDISVGGIGFYSNTVFFKKQRFILNLHAIKEDLNVEVEVLRIRRQHPFASGYRHFYAGKFVGLRNDQQRMICEYVFKVELENHCREREKDPQRDDE